MSYQSDARNWSNHFGGSIKNDTSEIIGFVSSDPQFKGKSISSYFTVFSIKDSLGNWQNKEGRLLLNLETDSLSISLKYGDVLALKGLVKEIGKEDNPHAFNPSAYYSLDNIYHQTYLKSGYFKLIDTDAGNSFWSYMISWRHYLAAVFDKNFKDSPNEKAVAAALVLGYKANFSKELRNAYAETGVTHVLSVSGLHVGLVAVLMGWIIRKLRRKQKNDFNKYESLLLILGIWIYVILTGASPSVLRSGLMFSLMIGAGVLNRKLNIYNSLAASAFLLLFIDPKMIWDIGFQLSYLALLGIVFFHPYIYKIFYFKFKWFDWAWNLTAVGIAAQISTVPISLFYFHQFPSYFWLSGLAVIPLATLALYSGIFLLLSDAIPLLSDLIGIVCYGSIYLMNATVFLVQQIPLSLIEGFWLEVWEMILWYLIILLAAVFLAFPRKRYLYAVFMMLIIATMVQFYSAFRSLGNEKLFVYKVYKGTALDFISANKAVVLIDSSSDIRKLDFVRRSNAISNKVVLDETIVKLFQDSIIQNNLVIGHSGFIQYGDLKILIPRDVYLNNAIKTNFPVKVDLLILCGNPKIRDITFLETNYDFRYIVFDASNSPYRIEKWKRQCIENNIPFFDCSEQGKELKYKKLLK